MTKSKRKPAPAKHFHDLLRRRGNEDLEPLAPKYLQETFDALEAAVGRTLNDRDRERAILWISHAISQVRFDVAAKEAAPTKTDLRLNLARLQKQISALVSSLSAMSVTEYSIASPSPGSIERVIEDLREMTRRIDSFQGQKTGKNLPPVEFASPPEAFSFDGIDPKLQLLWTCQFIIKDFTGEYAGRTNGGTLTTFASAVYRCATDERAGDFKRQLDKLGRFMAEMEDIGNRAGTKQV